MSKQPSMTIISVTGSQQYAQSSMYAIERSFRELKKALPMKRLQCCLVAPEKPQNLPAYIRFIPCKPFGYIEYNLFILYSLAQIVNTDFALIVQNDGFVLDGNNWRDEFFEYDYIGSPIYPLFAPDWQPAFFDSTQEAVENLADFLRDNPTFIEAQNGGFSLRSQKMLNLPRKLGLTLNIPIPDLVSTRFAELQFLGENGRGQFHHEDLFLTVCQRELLIKNGIKFAPSEIAGRFGAESLISNLSHQIEPDEILGCHLAGHLQLTSPDSLIRTNPANDFFEQQLLHSRLQIQEKEAEHK